MTNRLAALHSTRWARALSAAAAGVVTGLAFQPVGWWPLAIVGAAALTLLVDPRGWRGATWAGYWFGVAFLGVTVGWLRVIAIPVAVVLVVFESVWFALLALGIRAVRRLPAWPVWTAAVWSLVEFAYARFPFGGFGWTRLGYTAVDSPLNGLFPFVAVSGLSFVVAFSAQLVAWSVLEFRGSRRRRTLLAAGVTLAILVALGLSGRAYAPAASGQTLNVGMVQGNVDGVGVGALGRQRSVTNNHLSETVALMAKARSGAVPVPDFVLWPENSTDIDPTVDPITGAVVQQAAELADRPILVGAVMDGPGPDERQTTGLWWDPDKGVLARYDKRNLVPFGEWIPFRSALLPYFPLLRLVGAQSVPGRTPGVLTVPVPGKGTVKVGDMICFELAYDATVYDTVRNGAQVLMVQSNNATYAGTGQVFQQYAITRARAMELRREILVATTNSLSGFIAADGSVILRTTERTSDSTVVTMPLRDSLTPAAVWGGTFDGGLAALGVFGIGWSALRRRKGLAPASAATDL